MKIIFLFFSEKLSPTLFFKEYKCSQCQAQASSNKYQKVHSTKFFGTVRQKIFEKNCATLIDEIFRHQKLSETQNASPTKNFCFFRQNNFDEKSWFLFRISFWYQKLSDTPKENLHKLLLSDKSFDTFLWYAFHQTCSPKFQHRTFRQCQKLPETQETFRNTKKGSLTNFSAQWHCQTESILHLLVIPSYGLTKISRQTNELRQLWGVLNFSFRL